jgi:cephalosporin hydroxylase
MLYDVKPDLIIETGTNSGGGSLYMAVLMEAINPECKIFTIDTLPIDEWIIRFKNPQSKGKGKGEEEEEEGYDC